MSEPKVLVYDLESAPATGYSWSKWDTNIIKFTQDWFLLTISWMWLGEDKIHVKGLPDFPGYVPGSTDDRALVELIHQLFDAADATITHNGRNFDQPKARTRMITLGLPPHRPFVEIDTLKEARKHFAFLSNSLEDLAAQLGLGIKGKPGFDVWEGCMRGDMASWRKMKAYCRNDVVLLRDLYLTMRPWIDHPNLALIADKPDVCPRCQAEGTLIVRGYRYTSVSKKVRYQCSNCHGYCTGRPVVKTDVSHVV